MIRRSLPEVIHRHASLEQVLHIRTVHTCLATRCGQAKPKFYCALDLVAASLLTQEEQKARQDAKIHLCVWHEYTQHPERLVNLSLIVALGNFNGVQYAVNPYYSIWHG